MTQERLQKILARAGISSRRAAEQLITGGHVRVNGEPVHELGTRADPERDRIEVDGRPIARERHVYYLIHKPRGIVTTLNDPEGRPSLDELLRDIPERVYPVGRLDFHTSGALLLTNDGDLAQALLHPSHAVPKTYVAKLSREIDDYMLHALQSGVVLDDGYKTQPAHVVHLRDEEGKSWLEITITEGKNRQIHRMVESLDTRVMRLSRLSFAGLSSEGLRPGAIRPLSRDEIAMLMRQYLPRELAETRMHEERTWRELESRAARRGESTQARRGERGGRGTSREERVAQAPRGQREGRGPRRDERNARPRGGDTFHFEGETRGAPRPSAFDRGRGGERRGSGSTRPAAVDRAREGERRGGGEGRAGKRGASGAPGATRGERHGGRSEDTRDQRRSATTRGGKTDARGQRSSGDRDRPRPRAEDRTPDHRTRSAERETKQDGRKAKQGVERSAKHSGRSGVPGAKRGARRSEQDAKHSGHASTASKGARDREPRANKQSDRDDKRSGGRERSARPHEQKSGPGVDSRRAARHKSRPT